MTQTKVEQYFSEGDWLEERKALRQIVLQTGLTETLKWKSPCYTAGGQNIVIIAHLKDCVTLGFFRGILVKDDAKILEKPGENSHAGRVVRLRSVQEISTLKPLLIKYINESVQAYIDGQTVPKNKKPIETPEELSVKMAASQTFRDAFNKLSPGRQRGYLLFFSGAKKSETRSARIERYVDRILKGKGLHDCVCGLSKKMPNCDGSHKYIS